MLRFGKHIGLVLIFLTLSFVGRGNAYAKAATLPNQKLDIVVDVEENVTSLKKVVSLIPRDTQQLFVSSGETPNDVSIDLKFWPYNSGEKPSSFIGKTAETFRKKIGDHPVAYAVSIFFTTYGTFSWVHVGGRYSPTKQIAIILYQLFLQHFYLINGDFWGKSIEYQAEMTTKFLELLGVKYKLDHNWLPVRYATIITTALAIGETGRMICNLDSLKSHFYNVNELLGDLTNTGIFVSTDFPWSYFGSQIDYQKNPEAHKFINYYNRVRYILFGLTLKTASAYFGKPGAITVLVTHGLAGWILNLGSEKVLNYMEAHKWGTYVELTPARIKTYYKNLNEKVSDFFKPTLVEECEEALSFSQLPE
jgi:hypothetical protein